MSQIIFRLLNCRLSLKLTLNMFSPRGLKKSFRRHCYDVMTYVPASLRNSFQNSLRWSFWIFVSSLIFTKSSPRVLQIGQFVLSLSPRWHVIFVTLQILLVCGNILAEFAYNTTVFFRFALYYYPSNNNKK